MIIIHLLIAIFFIRKEILIQSFPSISEELFFLKEITMGLELNIQRHFIQRAKQGLLL